MKDANCGAFAVIYCGMYLLLQLGLFYELRLTSSVLLYCPVFVLSRTLSALCALTMPNARKNGMLSAYTKNAENRRAITALAALLVITAARIIVLSPIKGVVILAASAVAAAVYRIIALKSFGGVTGDTSGFFFWIIWLKCTIPKSTPPLSSNS